MSPVATTDLTEVYSARTLDTLRNSLQFVSLCNRNWQADLQRNNAVQIPVANNTHTETSRTRNQAWLAAEATDVNLVEFKPNQRRDAANQILFEDELETRISMLAATADDQAYALAAEVDKYVGGVMRDGATNANTQNYLTGTTYIGADGISYSANGTVNSGGPYSAVHDALDKISVSAQADAVASPAGITNRSITAIMKPGLYAALRRYALAQKWNTDSLNTAMLTDATVGPRPAGFAGSWLGINIIVSNNVPDETVSSKNHQLIIFSTRSATTFASQPGVRQMFNPNQNQVSSEPSWLLRQRIRFDAMVVDANQLYVAQIKAAA